MYFPYSDVTTPSNQWCVSLRRMSPVEDCENTVLRQCVQARSQLETAIAGVTRAEAALRDNSREVRVPRTGPWGTPDPTLPLG